MRALSLAEIAELTKPRVRVLPKGISGPNPGTSLCNHQWQPAKTIVTSPGLKEFPTKKCALCSLWLCLQSDEIQEEAITDMGDWLA